MLRREEVSLTRTFQVKVKLRTSNITAVQFRQTDLVERKIANGLPFEQYSFLINRALRPTLQRVFHTLRHLST